MRKVNDIAIENYIPKGYQNRVSREYLASVTGIGDRKIRQAIDEAADRGIIVVNIGSGYFVPTDSFEDRTALLCYYKQEKSRATSMIKRVRSIEKLAFKDYNQTSVFDFNIDGDSGERKGE